MDLINELLIKKSNEEGRKITLTETSVRLDIPISSLHHFLNGNSTFNRKPEREEMIADYFGLTVKKLRKKVILGVKERYGLKD